MDNSTVLTAVGTKGTANGHLKVASVTLRNRKTKGRYIICEHACFVKETCKTGVGNAVSL